MRQRSFGRYVVGLFVGFPFIHVSLFVRSLVICVDLLAYTQASFEGKGVVGGGGGL